MPDHIQLDHWTGSSNRSTIRNSFNTTYLTNHPTFRTPNHWGMQPLFNNSTIHALGNQPKFNRSTTRTRSNNYSGIQYTRDSPFSHAFNHPFKQPLVHLSSRSLSHQWGHPIIQPSVQPAIYAGIPPSNHPFNQPYSWTFHHPTIRLTSHLCGHSTHAMVGPTIHAPGHWENQWKFNRSTIRIPLSKRSGLQYTHDSPFSHAFDHPFKQPTVDPSSRSTSHQWGHPTI